MSYNARVEELSDSSDPDEVDPSALEDSKVAAKSIMNPANVPAQAGPQTSGASIDPEEIKGWHCLYPLYFDSKKTRAEGRRVGSEMAVENPLAREICDAIRPLGLRLAFEAGKMHPRDWSNPGRVRVRLMENGRPMSRDIRNSKTSRLAESDELAKHLSRASFIHQSRPVSQSTSCRRGNSDAPAHPGYATTDETTGAAGHSSGMENRHYSTIPLACHERRRG